MNTVPHLPDFDFIMVNTSGGKDSQTALRVVVAEADKHGIRDRIVVVHADLGRMEWAGVKELAQRQAEHYGLPFHVVKYQNREGQQKTLLDYVRKRGKWPSSTTRYCTSDFKRGPCRRVLTHLGREARKCKPTAKVLNVFGFRAEESPARAKRSVYALNESASGVIQERLGGRALEVWDWLPIHEWTESQVWDDIRASGVPYHRAYDLGMPRLSCCFCIFAPRAALMIAGQANPELLDEYVAVEKEIGHDFQHKKPIREIKEAIARGETAGAMDGNWNM